MRDFYFHPQRHLDKFRNNSANILTVASFDHIIERKLSLHLIISLEKI